MKLTLAQALIERGVLNHNSRIIADCPVRAMGDIPTEMEMALTVTRAVFEDGTIKLHASLAFLARRSSGSTACILFVSQQHLISNQMDWFVRQERRGVVSLK